LNFDVKILGCNSASFAFGRHHAAQLVSNNQNLFLVDCGEATQIQLMRYQVRYNRIHHIFISHLHGDHYLGLMGLLFTFHLQGRQDPLHVYGPAGLDEIITLQLRHSESRLHYEIHFHRLESDDQLLFENEDLQVFAVEMNHRIPCFGFVFEEKWRKHKIIREKLPDSITRENLTDLKEGRDITDGSGVRWKHTDLTIPPSTPRKYAYCADTRVLDREIGRLMGTNLMYHEATFTSDMQARAESTFHSTAAEAGRFAARHQVRELVIGHYSSRYFDIQPFLEEARTTFSRTTLAIEGQQYDVPPVQPVKTKPQNAEYSFNRNA
jgi:ribonuclease Z